MMHLFVNSLAASAGGGLTYIRNVIPHLATTPDVRVTVALSSGLRQEFRAEFLSLTGGCDQAPHVAGADGHTAFKLALHPHLTRAQDKAVAFIFIGGRSSAEEVGFVVGAGLHAALGEG